MQKVLFVLNFVLLFLSQSEAQTQFADVNALLRYASSKSITLQSGDIKLAQAKKAKLAALLSIPDPTGSNDVSFTDNTKLPVNLFPAEVFGGAPGTYKKITTGIQYVTYANENSNVKLVNPKGWANLKLANANLAVTASDNKVTLKSLYEDIATAYFNIIALQEELEATQQNLTAADTLLAITRNKYNEGISRQQEVNDAEVSYLNTKETANQIKFSIKRQYLALHILCDVPDSESLIITQKLEADSNFERPLFVRDSAGINNKIWKEKAALYTYKGYKASNYPTLSFFQSLTTQQYDTRFRLFDKNVSWIPSSYVGIKLSLPLPGAATISQIASAKYDYRLAEKNTEQQSIKADLELQQLVVDYDKWVSQARTYAGIYRLRKDTYEKNVDLYKEGIYSLDQTLSDFDNMVMAHYNVISAEANIGLMKTKADLNNRIK